MKRGSSNYNIVTQGRIDLSVKTKKKGWKGSGEENPQASVGLGFDTSKEKKGGLLKKKNEQPLPLQEGAAKTAKGGLRLIHCPGEDSMSAKNIKKNDFRKRARLCLGRETQGKTPKGSEKRSRTECMVKISQSRRLARERGGKKKGLSTGMSNWRGASQPSLRWGYVV